MKLSDAVKVGFFNLKKSMLRTILTTLGVIIGIGTLSSMISFGVGIESNVLNSFKNSDLFNGLIITNEKINLDDAVNSGEIIEKDKKSPSPPLNDSTLQIIKKIEDVEIAYPEIFIPAKLEFKGNFTKTSVKAFPSEMKKYPPFNNLSYGRFVRSGKNHEIVLTDRVLRKMKIKIKDSKEAKLTEKEKKEGFVLLAPDSIIGSKVKITTASVNENMLFGIAVNGIFQNSSMDSLQSLNVFKDNTVEFVVTGVNMSDKKMVSNNQTGNAMISIESAELLPRTEFNNVWELLGRSEENSKSKYNSLYVRVKSAEYVRKVQKKLKKMNFQIFSFLEQLDEIRQNFIIIDMMLSAIGIISLFVASLGIINTMVMSILERKKEIGIMKAVGASEFDIKKIFFVEASIIGILGGIIGLVLGWGVTEIASIVIKSNIPEGELTNANLFLFPVWLIFSAVGFSLIVSLIAALYPAYRASKVDPVIALRNE